MFGGVGSSLFTLTPADVLANDATPYFGTGIIEDDKFYGEVVKSMNADLGPVETEPDTIFVKIAADATKWVSTGHPVSQCRVDFFWTLHCRQVPAVFHQNQFGTRDQPCYFHAEVRRREHVFPATDNQRWTFDRG